MPDSPTIGILAVQGAFAEHKQKLEVLGAHCTLIRRRSDLEHGLEGLVLPGGESTVQGKLLRDLKLLQPLRELILRGLPVLATCAGLILLAERIEGERSSHFATLPVHVLRNAYGRQQSSFCTQGELLHLGSVPMTFIRAPQICRVGPGVEVLARLDGHITAVRYGNQMGMTFHPELTDCRTVHRCFLKMAAERRGTQEIPHTV